MRTKSLRPQLESSSSDLPCRLEFISGRPSNQEKDKSQTKEKEKDNRQCWGKWSFVDGVQNSVTSQWCNVSMGKTNLWPQCFLLCTAELSGFFNTPQTKRGRCVFARVHVATVFFFSAAQLGWFAAALLNWSCDGVPCASCERAFALTNHDCVLCSVFRHRRENLMKLERLTPNRANQQEQDPCSRLRFKACSIMLAPRLSSRALRCRSFIHSLESAMLPTFRLRIQQSLPWTQADSGHRNERDIKTEQPNKGRNKGAQKARVQIFHHSRENFNKALGDQEMLLGTDALQRPTEERYSGKIPKISALTVSPGGDPSRFDGSICPKQNWFLCMDKLWLLVLLYAAFSCSV